MTSTELKHQARLKEWALAIQECRSSELSVKQWCRERGITTATYYRWEREVLSAGAPRLPDAVPGVFVEISNPSRQCRNVAEPSATLRIGESSIEFYQEIGPELLLAMIKGVRSSQRPAKGAVCLTWCFSDLE